MKKCPFCAEEIQDEAIKCKHCGEFLDGYSRPVPQGAAQPATAETSPKAPWYFNSSLITIAVLCVGPLALPLIWWHPTLSAKWKAGLTVVIAIFTYLLYLGTMNSLKTLQELMDMLNT